MKKKPWWGGTYTSSADIFENSDPHAAEAISGRFEKAIKELPGENCLFEEFKEIWAFILRSWKT